MEDESASSGVSPCRSQRPASRSTRFKGMVLLQNGHWGAQIYSHHQRVWLGTFKSEAEAAAAYDSAAIRLRSGDSHRNLPWPHSSFFSAELRFQADLATDTLLAMIKDGSYPRNLDKFIRSTAAATAAPGPRPIPAAGVGVTSHLLFRKELTPSDVGKLNRLVIPKRHAVKHFPGLAAAGRAEGSSRELAFRDSGMRQWKFRYSYWRSSQSFVFTRGWNRFVREKRLGEKDEVAFYWCRCGPREEAAGGDEGFFLIDVVRTEVASDGNESEGVSVLLNLSQSGSSDLELDQKVVVEEQDLAEKPKAGFRLFGVQIYASE